MPLDASSLQTKIKAAFKRAKDTPPPANPNDADRTQELILNQLAQDLADAVNAFVRSGDVMNVTVQVKNPANAVIGTGVQTTTVQLQ